MFSDAVDSKQPKPIMSWGVLMTMLQQANPDHVFWHSSFQALILMSMLSKQIQIVFSDTVPDAVDSKQPKPIMRRGVLMTMLQQANPDHVFWHSSFQALILMSMLSKQIQIVFSDTVPDAVDSKQPKPIMRRGVLMTMLQQANPDHVFWHSSFQALILMSMLSKQIQIVFSDTVPDAVDSKQPKPIMRRGVLMTMLQQANPDHVFWHSSFQALILMSMLSKQIQIVFSDTVPDAVDSKQPKPIMRRGVLMTMLQQANPDHVFWHSSFQALILMSMLSKQIQIVFSDTVPDAVDSKQPKPIMRRGVLMTMLQQANPDHVFWHSSFQALILMSMLSKQIQIVFSDTVPDAVDSKQPKPIMRRGVLMTMLQQANPDHVFWHSSFQALILMSMLSKQIQIVFSDTVPDAVDSKQPKPIMRRGVLMTMLQQANPDHVFWHSSFQALILMSMLSKQIQIVFSDTVPDAVDSKQPKPIMRRGVLMTMLQQANPDHVFWHSSFQALILMSMLSKQIQIVFSDTVPDAVDSKQPKPIMRRGVLMTMLQQANPDHVFWHSSFQALILMSMLSKQIQIVFSDTVPDAVDSKQPKPIMRRGVLMTMLQQANPDHVFWHSSFQALILMSMLSKQIQIVFSDTVPDAVDSKQPKPIMRRGVLMTMLQQNATTLPLWVSKPGEK